MNLTENLFKPHSVRSYSGKYIDLKDPDPQTFFPIDIATQLARKCRFGGATKKFYSVAEHSVWCALKAEEKHPHHDRLPLLMLMHDAHEFCLEDVGSPVKAEFQGYKSLANKIQNAIDTRFRCCPSFEQRKLMEAIDLEALQWEWENKVLHWSGLALDEQTRIEYFLHHFKRLCKTPFVIAP